MLCKWGWSGIAPAARHTLRVLYVRPSSSLIQSERGKSAVSLPERLPLAEDPGECSSYKYTEPGAARQALHYLATLPSESSESSEPHMLRIRALCALRGALSSPQEELRDLAQSTVEELKADETCSIDSVHGSLRRFVMDASAVELEIEDAVDDLVTVWPAPQDAFLSVFNNAHGRLMLKRVKPMDVLWVPEHRPEGTPHSAHAFLRMVQLKKGPFYRDTDYILVTKAEYNHFPWVMEQIRVKAQEFFYQYRSVELKAGRQKLSLHREADAFITMIAEKLFSLAMILHMPSILERQAMLDASGSSQYRWLFAQHFQQLPPPLEAVKIAFGIDAAEWNENLTADSIFMDWQRSNLWRRKRTSKLKKEKIFPTVKQLGDMALATHLRHRPFVSMLQELNAVEEPLLRPWYRHIRPEEPILSVVWSREFLKSLSAYCANALQALEVVQPDRSASMSPLRIMCVGSSCSRLRLYLHYLLSKFLKDKAQDLKMVALVPERRTSHRVQVARWPPLPMEVSGFDPPEAGYTLEEALEAYAPTLVLCSCMPPNIDWSSSFRRSASVMEYLLIGPADSTRSGQLLETWGLRNGFGKPPEPPWAGRFTRHELPELGRWLLGTDDAPGRVGTNRVVSFRRLVKPSFTLALDQRMWPELTKNGTGVTGAELAHLVLMFCTFLHAFWLAHFDKNNAVGLVGKTLSAICKACSCQKSWKPFHKKGDVFLFGILWLNFVASRFMLLLFQWDRGIQFFSMATSPIHPHQ